MTQNSYKQYFSEGLLIVFSVLFALFINQLYDDYKTRQKKNTAIIQIKQELSQNASNIKDWRAQHIAIRNKISSLVSGKNDSLKNVLKEKGFLDLGVLTEGGNLVNSMLTSTAWETTKATGLISEFNFKTIEGLTQVYAMQEIVQNRTLKNILDFYFDLDSHKIDNLDVILKQYELRFYELVGQERLLIYFYEQTLKEL